MLENYSPVAVIFSNLYNLRSKLSLESLKIFFFPVTDFNEYLLACTETKTQCRSSVVQWFIPRMAIKFWFLLVILVALEEKNRSFILRQKTHVKRTENHHKLTL